MLSRKTLAIVAAAAALNAAPVLAQPVVFGSAEGAGDNTMLLLLGGAWSPGHIGLQPYVSVIGYNLRLDNAAVSVSRNVVAPQAGLKWQTAGSATQVGVGYAFTSGDNVSLAVGAPSGQGVFGAFQWDYWGTGKRTAEFIASYGTDQEFLWSRLIGFQRLTATSPLHVGAEASLFGSPRGVGFWDAQVGPAIEWRFTPQFRLGAAAGLKIGLSPSTNNKTNAYGRISFLWLPTIK